MTKYVDWAQISILQKNTNQPACCKTGKPSYVVNGRTGNLTRTKTTYACNGCIATVLANQDWAGITK
jgi:hypothetical protein